MSTPGILPAARRLVAGGALALAALPALAQIIVVPLDPVDPEEVLPGGELLPGEILPGQAPVFEPLPGELPTFEPPPGETPLGPGEFFPSETPGAEEGIELEPLAPLEPGSVVGEDVMTVEEDVVAAGTGAILKGLDKLAGTVEEMRLAQGETAGLGWLQITLGECRYPVGNPSGDAYAWVVIREQAGEAPIFEGWMIASSPALNALDHARFDVWVINCTTE